MLAMGGVGVVVCVLCVLCVVCVVCWGVGGRHSWTHCQCHQWPREPIGRPSREHIGREADMEGIRHVRERLDGLLQLTCEGGEQLPVLRVPRGCLLRAVVLDVQRQPVKPPEHRAVDVLFDQRRPQCAVADSGGIPRPGVPLPAAPEHHPDFVLVRGADQLRGPVAGGRIADPGVPARVRTVSSSAEVGLPDLPAEHWQVQRQHAAGIWGKAGVWGGEGAAGCSHGDGREVLPRVEPKVLRAGARVRRPVPGLVVEVGVECEDLGAGLGAAERAAEALVAAWARAGTGAGRLAAPAEAVAVLVGAMYSMTGALDRCVWH